MKTSQMLLATATLLLLTLAHSTKAQTPPAVAKAVQEYVDAFTGVLDTLVNKSEVFVYETLLRRRFGGQLKKILESLESSNSMLFLVITDDPCLEPEQIQKITTYTSRLNSLKATVDSITISKVLLLHLDKGLLPTIIDEFSHIVQDLETQVTNLDKNRSSYRCPPASEDEVMLQLESDIQAKIRSTLKAYQ